MMIADFLKNKNLPMVELEVLLSFTLKRDRSFLSGFPNHKITTSQEKLLERYLLDLEKGRPLAYILGYKEFYGFKFLVNPQVLIPRPETEILVEKVLNFASKNKAEQLRVVDVGTGSGCIAISLSLKNPKLKIFATDMSSNSLNIAKKNANLLKVMNKITFFEKDLLDNFNEKVDVIAANLPYIPTANWEKLPTSIKDFEPRLALDSQESNLSLYNKLFSQAKNILNEKGIIFYEIDGDIFSLTQKELLQKY